jgi:hypothetical protein
MQYTTILTALLAAAATSVSAHNDDDVQTSSVTNVLGTATHSPFSTIPAPAAITPAAAITTITLAAEAEATLCPEPLTSTIYETVIVEEPTLVAPSPSPSTTTTTVTNIFGTATDIPSRFPTGPPTTTVSSSSTTTTTTTTSCTTTLLTATRAFSTKVPTIPISRVATTVTVVEPACESDAL